MKKVVETPINVQNVIISSLYIYAKYAPYLLIVKAGNMSSLVDFAMNSLLFLLWILFTCTRRNVLPKLDREFLVRNLKWGWCFFFRSIDQTKADDVRVNGKELGTRCYEGKLGFEGAAECAVCLCKIEEGDEIRDLRSWLPLSNKPNFSEDIGWSSKETGKQKALQRRTISTSLVSSDSQGSIFDKHERAVPLPHNNSFRTFMRETGAEFWKANTKGMVNT
ncbi:hypothetical protein RJ640_030931 [Escallonia rubra]|uniref:Uncharacterized protein n=1 Tax=Escallonia rubra TaxID=112253 RepID=A0AA88R0X0_9ASTE|nr:hypothetical protein RJ640_030931 [Escallonia rubra]